MGLTATATAIDLEFATTPDTFAAGFHRRWVLTLLALHVGPAADADADGVPLGSDEAAGVRADLIDPSIDTRCQLTAPAATVKVMSLDTIFRMQNDSRQTEIISYFKHITTVSGTAIVVLSGFAQHFAGNAMKGKTELMWSLMLLAACVVCSVCGNYVFVLIPRKKMPDFSDFEVKDLSSHFFVAVIAYSIALTSFIVGMMMFVGFTIQNIQAQP